MSLFVDNSCPIFMENQITRKEVQNIALFEFEYPYVYITFNNERITDDYNLEIFFETWLSISNDKKPYIIV